MYAVSDVDNTGPVPDTAWPHLMLYLALLFCLVRILTIVSCTSGLGHQASALKNNGRCFTLANRRALLSTCCQLTVPQ